MQGIHVVVRPALWVLVLSLGIIASPAAQRRPAAVTLGTGTSMPGFLTATLVFLAADTDKDGVVTRQELEDAGGRWFTAAAPPGVPAVTEAQLATALDAAMPRSGLAVAFNMGGRGAQPRTPHPATVEAMRAALPHRPPAPPRQARKVLVLARAAGFVHASIPLAAQTIVELGQTTGAWSATVTYDAADINSETLPQYDAVFLASTTGAFLDDPADAAATAARREALLTFVRGGKGLAGIHAASDSYHRDTAAEPRGGAAAAIGAFSVGATLAPVMLRQGDTDADGRLSRPEIDALTSAWFAALDASQSGRLLQSDAALLALMIPHATGADAPTAPRGPDTQTGTWPEFNRMLGAYFKSHWLDPQRVTVRIDDPSSPLTAMFRGRSFDVHDEIYAMSIHSWSRDDVHVLTSIDYDAMRPADRALEEYPRADHDYALSWIRREGEGRVFYQALGHSERIYANRPILEHLLAGMQYVLGDLAADTAAARH
jgi:type 1 glutamine amidotransferase